MQAVADSGNNGRSPETTVSKMDKALGSGAAPTLYELVAAMQDEVDQDQGCSWRRVMLLIGRACCHIDAEIGGEARRSLGENCTYAD